MARARATGQRVEVLSKRSETMEVLAEPNGTFTAVLHPGPVRVRRGGGWVPVDTTLQRRPDGSVGPRAAVVSLAFSGGGSGPLVRLGREGRRVTLGWPWRLPVPRLAGDTATYPEVLAGVDLRLTAAATGFHEVLVVKTRRAAGNPALARLRFGLRTSGLWPRTGGDGGSVLVDAKGRTVFASPPPAMWDSAARRHRAVGRFELSRGAISLLPDRRLLSDPATVFPVVIDPDYGVPFAGWAKVFSGHPGDAYWGGGIDGPVGKVGRCYEDGTCNGIGTARTYVQFDIRALHGAVILNIPNVTTGAELNAHEVYAPSCSPRGVDLEHVNPFGSGLTWSNQQASFPGAIGGPRVEAHGYNANCAAAWIGWGVGDQVRYSNARADYVAFMLHADNEGDQLAWKKFDGYQLLVHYDWPPNLPSNMSWSAGTSTTPCSTDPQNPHYVNNRAGELTLKATATDPDGLATPLWMAFEWRNRGHGDNDLLGSTVVGPGSNGSEFTKTFPPGAFADGQQLSWRAHAGDSWVPGPWGPQTGSWLCEIDIDNTAPGTPIVIPDPSQPPTVGAPVTYTVRAATADGDVTGFRYGLTQGGSVCATTASVPAGTLGGSATIKVTPLKATFWDLWVAGVDRAGNLTGPTGCAHYRFQVQPGRPAVAHWAMDGHWLLTAVPDSSSGHNHDGTVAIGPARWTLGRVGDALQFDGGSGAYVAPGGGSAVRTDQSFSVAAWVKLDRADGATHAAVSQDGSNVHGFLLGYLSEYQRFAFRMPAQNSTTGQKAAVQASSAPQVGVWTHLTGTYDVTSHQLRLYVNGVLQGTATMSTPWNAGGGVQIGRGKYGDGYTDGWAGAIDEVRIYDRVLSDLPSLEPGETAPRSEIGRLAGPPVEEGYYPLDEGAGTAAGDVSGNYRTATLSGGAALTTAGHIGGALQLHSANSGAAATTGPAVRTDRSFTVAAWVKLDQAGTSTRAAVSQDGANGTHAFLLGYLSEYQRFAFRMLTEDGDAGQMVAVQATSAPQVGDWTHLAGTYDEASHELRLYVNGVLQGAATMSTPWNATGGLQIGRDKYHGQYADYFDGSIDEVHVDSGVLSDQEIADLSGQTEPRPPSLLAGSFERYASHDGRHYVGTGPVPPGHYLEGPLGMAAPQGAPNTRMIYSCRGFYLSQQANCSGGEVLGEAGLMYTTPPAGVPTQAVYRCLVLGTGDHFASFDPACESTPDKVSNEFRLGYTRLYAPLIRYVGPDGAHWTSTHGQLLPAGYRPEVVLGYVAMADVGQGSMLRLCQRRGTDDEFLSTDSACEGEQDMGTWTSGWLWPSPPAGVTQSRLLYSCQSGAGERFESLDRFCEGGTQVRQLGYVITQF